MLLLAISHLAACAGGADKGAPAVALTHCGEPRPEVCTMEYNPVCASLASAEQRSYSNACSACGDPQVEAHRPGACE